MRRLVLFAVLLARLTARSQSVEWLSDAGTAQARAKAENKLVLLDFTGSDWCSWCMKLKREVFDRPEFAQFAQANLVSVEVDFPHNRTLAQLQQHANARLKHTYGIMAYPTIILLNEDGRQVGRMGYVAGGPAAFIAQLQKVTGRKIPTARDTTPPPVAREAEQPRRPATWNPPPAPVAIHYGPLALKSISGTRDRRMVLINNATMMAGETAKVRAEDREVVVRCREIREDSVMITCDGKEMELKLTVIR
jgi:thioredoxin-related protein